MVSNECKIPISPTERQVDNLKDTLSLLQENIRFFKLLFLYEIVSYIGKLREQVRYFVLINLYFFVVELMEWIIFLLVYWFLAYIQLSFVQRYLWLWYDQWLERLGFLWRAIFNFNYLIVNQERKHRLLCRHYLWWWCDIMLKFLEVCFWNCLIIYKNVKLSLFATLFDILALKDAAMLHFAGVTLD